MSPNVLLGAQVCLKGQFSGVILYGYQLAEAGPPLNRANAAPDPPHFEDRPHRYDHHAAIIDLANENAVTRVRPDVLPQSRSWQDFHQHHIV